MLEGIDAALAAGLAPVKVNMVVKRGRERGRRACRWRSSSATTGHVLRFIEYMDVGTTNGWRLEDVVPAAEIVELIGAEHPLEPVAPNYPGEVANRFRYRDGVGEIGVIASVTQPFCGGCTRARLSAEGQLYTCLFASAGLRPARDRPRRGDRRGAARVDRGDLDAPRRPLLRGQDGRHRRRAEHVEMSHIGG